jgi:AraC family transcriptional regulator, ethanolamine operon transcriptional activator
VNGQFSQNQVCLGFTPRSEKPAWCNGFSLTNREILFFSEGTELQFRNAPRTSWRALLIDRRELQEVATILTGQTLQLPERGTIKVNTLDQAMNLFSIIELALTNLAGFKTPASPAGYLYEEIVNEFVRAVATNNSTGTRDFAGRRFAAMRRAEEFLREHMDCPFDSRGLCAATKMSERSIELLFKEAYGVSPRAWSQIARLNAAHRELLERDTHEIRVTEVATRWGFFHLGRFSALYRQLFGELPSVTAAKRRRR